MVPTHFFEFFKTEIKFLEKKNVLNFPKIWLVPNGNKLFNNLMSLKKISEFHNSKVVNFYFYFCAEIP